MDKFTLKLSKLKASDFKFRKEEVENNLDVFNIIIKKQQYFGTLILVIRYFLQRKQILILLTSDLLISNVNKSEI